MLLFIAGWLPLTAAGLLLSRYLRRDFAECMPAAMLGAILLLYLSGLGGFLEVGVYLLYALGIFCAGLDAYLLLRERKPLRGSAAFVAFAVCLAAVPFLCAGRRMLAWDEFSHWGTAVKNMYLLNDLPCAKASTAIYKSYPPVIGLIQYYSVHIFPAFREDVLFMAKDMFSFTLLLPFLSGVRLGDWKRLFPTLFLMLSLPLVEYFYFYRSVHVDGLMGLCFFYMLACAWRARPDDLFRWICCGLGAFALCGMKSSGIGVCVPVLAVIWIDVLLRRKEGGARPGWRVLIPLAAAVFLQLSWKIRLSASGAADYWNMSEALGPASFLRFFSSPLPYQRETLERFFAALFALREDTYAVRLSPFTWLMLPLLPAVGAWFASAKAETKRRIAGYGISLTAGYLFWLGVLLASYLFVFADFEALNLDGFERYSSTWQLGMEGFLLFVLLDVLAEERRSVLPAALVPLCLLTMNLFNGSDLAKATIAAPAYNAYSARQRSAFAPVPDLSGLDPQRDRVLFIGQQSEATGMDFYSLRYELTPLYVGMIGSWSLGEPYDGEDDWTEPMDAETWRSLVYASDYTHLYIYRADERFASDFGACFEDPSRIGDDTLFRIDRSGGTAAFTAE